MASGTEGARPRADGKDAAAGNVVTIAIVALIWAVAISGTLLLLWGSKLTFLLDDWEFLLYRTGFNAHSILDPHGEHIVVFPMLIYKALLATVGMDSALPFRVVSVGLFLLSSVLLFVFLGRRVGPLPALAGAAVVLFLGAGWEDLLWSFQVGYFGCMAVGVGALLALEREDRAGDAAATVLLALAILFSSLGLSFLAGAAVQVLVRPDRWRRLYILIVPALIYALWYLGWGHTAENSASLQNLARMPSFVLNGVAASLASLFGLALPGATNSAGGLEWGRPMVVVAAILIAWRVWYLKRVPSWLWVVVAVGGSFWVLAALNQEPGRDPTSSRYQYLGVVFVLLVAAELLRGVQLSRGALIAVGVVTLASIAPNVLYLHEAYSSYRVTSQLEKADLAALDITRDRVEPNFVLDESIADTGYVHVEAGPYFAASDQYGTPAYSPAELAEAAPNARFAADKVIFSALRVQGLETVPSPIADGARVEAAPPGGLVRIGDSCLSVPGGASSPQISLPPGGVLLEADGAPIEDIVMARYATPEFPVDFEEGLETGESARLAIPTDRSSRRWRMQLETAGSATVCPL